MSITLKAVLAAAALGFVTVGAASADTTFNAKFNYNPDLSPEVTYTAFERQARHACRVDSRNAGGLGGKLKYERACQAEMLANAVAATKSVGLISLHAAKTKPNAESVMASLK
ncbi:MAG: hypothetical protein KJ871_03815 [Alphaproteobacteria bacterium]|nr:hypothetical protein [Alphaproteobacteria bacterium]MBU2083493.1 hypothetical protein [Alphaproteobacteria bacterium]MBU2143541.1 hypothetical protein [Alphaproteobacteria bacterium]MBU2196058.1 hypothetical protein [Alphaproteobacteria bacterium]